MFVCCRHSISHGSHKLWFLRGHCSMLTELNESPPIPIRNSCKIIIIFFLLIPIRFFSFFSCSICYWCQLNNPLLMNVIEIAICWWMMLLWCWNGRPFCNRNTFFFFFFSSSTYAMGPTIFPNTILCSSISFHF